MKQLFQLSVSQVFEENSNGGNGYMLCMKSDSLFYPFLLQIPYTPQASSHYSGQCSLGNKSAKKDGQEMALDKIINKKTYI